MTSTSHPSSLRPRLSLVIITLDEEANIERCIRSVPWADDVVVLDSGSKDRTVEIARGLGARVFCEAWRGYRDQKARATELAAHDWVLSLDADEALSPEAVKELEEIFATGLLAEEHEAGGGRIDGLEFPRLSYHMERWIRHGGWYPDWQLRLFHRRRSAWSAGHVHERVAADRVRRLTSPIHHWPFADLSEQVRTNNNYSSLGARDLFDRGRRFHVLALVFKPWSKFMETYLIKGGWRDGLPGFIIAVGAAYSVFLKFAKLREMEHSHRRPLAPLPPPKGGES